MSVCLLTALNEFDASAIPIGNEEYRVDIFKKELVHELISSGGYDPR